MMYSLKVLLEQDDQDVSLGLENDAPLTEPQIKKIKKLISEKLNSLNDNNLDDKLGKLSLNNLKTLSRTPVLGKFFIDPAQTNSGQSKGTSAYDFSKYKSMQIVPFFVYGKDGENYNAENARESYNLIFLVPAIGVEISDENMEKHKKYFGKQKGFKIQKKYDVLLPTQIADIRVTDDELGKVTTSFKTGNPAPVPAINSKKASRRSSPQSESFDIGRNKENIVDNYNIIKMYNSNSHRKNNSMNDIFTGKLSNYLFENEAPESSAESNDTSSQEPEGVKQQSMQELQTWLKQNYPLAIFAENFLTSLSNKFSDSLNENQYLWVYAKALSTLSKHKYAAAEKFAEDLENNDLLDNITHAWNKIADSYQYLENAREKTKSLSDNDFAKIYNTLEAMYTKAFQAAINRWNFEDILNSTDESHLSKINNFIDLAVQAKTKETLNAKVTLYTTQMLLKYVYSKLDEYLTEINDLNFIKDYSEQNLKEFVEKVNTIKTYCEALINARNKLDINVTSEELNKILNRTQEILEYTRENVEDRVRGNDEQLARDQERNKKALELINKLRTIKYDSVTINSTNIHSYFAYVNLIFGYFRQGTFSIQTDTQKGEDLKFSNFSKFSDNELKVGDVEVSQAFKGLVQKIKDYRVTQGIADEEYRIIYENEFKLEIRLNDFIIGKVLSVIEEEITNKEANQVSSDSIINRLEDISYRENTVKGRKRVEKIDSSLLVPLGALTAPGRAKVTKLTLTPEKIVGTSETGVTPEEILSPIQKFLKKKGIGKFKNASNESHEFIYQDGISVLLENDSTEPDTQEPDVIYVNVKELYDDLFTEYLVLFGTHPAITNNIQQLFNTEISRSSSSTTISRSQINYKEILYKCLNKLLDVDRTGFEYIVVDSGLDTTFENIRNFRGTNFNGQIEQIFNDLNLTRYLARISAYRSANEMLKDFETTSESLRQEQNQVIKVEGNISDFEPKKMFEKEDLQKGNLFSDSVYSTAIRNVRKSKEEAGEDIKRFTDEEIKESIDQNFTNIIKDVCVSQHMKYDEDLKSVVGPKLDKWRKADEMSQEKHRRAKGFSRGASGSLGGLGGAGTGAILGGLIGMVGGPLGSVTGAKIGAALGTVAGGAYGATDKSKETFTSRKDVWSNEPTVKESVKKLSDTIKSLAMEIKNVTENDGTKKLANLLFEDLLNEEEDKSLTYEKLRQKLQSNKVLSFGFPDIKDKKEAEVELVESVGGLLEDLFNIKIKGIKNGGAALAMERLTATVDKDAKSGQPAASEVAEMTAGAGVPPSMKDAMSPEQFIMMMNMSGGPMMMMFMQMMMQQQFQQQMMQMFGQMQKGKVSGSQAAKTVEKASKGKMSDLDKLLEGAILISREGLPPIHVDIFKNIVSNFKDISKVNSNKEFLYSLQKFNRISKNANDLSFDNEIYSSLRFAIFENMVKNGAKETTTGLSYKKIPKELLIELSECVLIKYVDPKHLGSRKTSIKTFLESVKGSPLDFVNKVKEGVKKINSGLSIKRDKNTVNNTNIETYLSNERLEIFCKAFSHLGFTFDSGKSYEENFKNIIERMIRIVDESPKSQENSSYLRSYTGNVLQETNFIKNELKRVWDLK